MKTWIGRLAPLAFLVLAMSACQDGIITGDAAVDEEAIRAEAALVAADAMFRDLSLAGDPGLQGFGFGGAGHGGWASAWGQTMPGGPGGPCHSKGPGKGFECPDLVREGFTHSREVTFFDGDGNVQDAYDPLETASIELHLATEGSVEKTFWTATVERERTLVITGLEGEETAHTVNGTASGRTYRSRNPLEGTERSRDMTTTAEISDVVHAVPRQDNPYPLSGSITRHIQVVVMEDGEVVATREVTTVVTFDGTRYATLMVDGETYTIDLEKRGVKGRFGRKGG